MENVLSTLRNEGIVSTESILDWKNGNDVSEGKGKVLFNPLDR